MPRWRYSLRTFLLVIVATTAFSCVVANHFARCLRARQSAEWLAAHGVGSGLHRNDNFQQSNIWEFPAAVQVYMENPHDDPPTPLYWHHVNQLGPLTELAVHSEATTAREFHACLRAHRLTLRRISIGMGALSPDTALAIDKCSYLEDLFLNEMKSGDELFQLQPMPRLHSVAIKANTLHYHQLGDKDFAWLPMQPKLSELYLATSDMSSDLVDIVCRCRNLQRLGVGCGTIAQDDVRKLVACNNLRDVRLPPAFLSSEIVDQVLNSSITELDIRTCRISSDDLQRLLCCERLEQLWVRLGMLDGVSLDTNRSSLLTIWVKDDTQLTEEYACQIVARHRNQNSKSIKIEWLNGIPADLDWENYSSVED